MTEAQDKFATELAALGGRIDTIADDVGSLKSDLSDTKAQLAAAHEDLDESAMTDGVAKIDAMIAKLDKIHEGMKDTASAVSNVGAAAGGEPAPATPVAETPVAPATGDAVVTSTPGTNTPAVDPAPVAEPVAAEAPSQAPVAQEPAAEPAAPTAGDETKGA